MKKKRKLNKRKHRLSKKAKQKLLYDAVKAIMMKEEENDDALSLVCLYPNRAKGRKKG